MAETLRADVQARLRSIRPALSNHFGVALTASEGVGFSVMTSPEAFTGRTAIEPSPDATARGNETVRRRVSVVIFLNGASESPWALRVRRRAPYFYGLIDDPAWRDVGFPSMPTPDCWSPSIPRRCTRSHRSRRAAG